MAFAIIPVEANPCAEREGWLTMNQADEMVCELFNEPVDPKHYCHNWFDSFYYFDWYNVKGFYHFKDDYVYDGFKTADKAVLHFLQHCLHTPYEKNLTLWDCVEDSVEYVKKYIEPIIRMFYDKGYKIISLNLN
jgi:hypothetical protein